MANQAIIESEGSHPFRLAPVLSLVPRRSTIGDTLRRRTRGQTRQPVGFVPLLTPCPNRIWLIPASATGFTLALRPAPEPSSLHGFHHPQTALGRELRQTGRFPAVDGTIPADSPVSPGSTGRRAAARKNPSPVMGSVKPGASPIIAQPSPLTAAWRKVVRLSAARTCA